MAQAIKLAVISILAILGIGALGGGYYMSNFYIEDAINEGIYDLLVVKENFKTDDPTGYADWLTNEDADDAPSFKKYYFWNLTNPDDYLTGSIPVYEEIGPYVYQQFNVKINVSITATTMEYQTYTYYKFSSAQSFSGASENDVIINVNPAYMGVIAGATSEAALVTGFVGPTIAGLLEGMQTDFTDGSVATGVSKAVAGIMASLAGDFVSNVRIQGTALALNTTLDGLINEFPETVLTQAVALGLLDIQTALTEAFHTAVNATTAANVMYGNWATAQTLNGTDVANNDYFNSTSFFTTYSTLVAGAPPIQGIGDYIGNNLGYSNSSITKLLWDGPDLIPVQGWFDDLVTGAGILGFLQLYENATLEVGGLTKTILGAAYGVTDTQLDAAAGYLLNYLIADNPAIEGAYQAGNNGQTTLEAAQVMFQAQWANATHIPGGADINSDGLTPDGFEVGIPVASGLSNVTVITLFDPSNPLSLTNDTQGIFAWVGAAFGNTTLQGLISSTYTGLINSTQLTQIYAWLGSFRNATIYAGLLAKFGPEGVGELKDLGYLHWGDSSVTSGLSLWDIKPELGAYPEPWAWALNLTSTPFTLNMSNSENLLTGTYNLTDITSVGAFKLWGGQSGDGNLTALPIINSAFGTKLNATDLDFILQFLDYVADTFVLTELPVTSYDDLPAYQWGNSTVTEGLSVNEISPVGFWPELWAFANRTLSQDLIFDLADSLTLTTGLQTPEGAGAFLAYGLSAAAGNATAKTIIKVAFGGIILSDAEIGIITQYLGYLLNTLVLPVMQVNSTADIGYAHWGSSVITGGLSLKDLAPDLGLPNVPEFWAWANNMGTPKNLTLAQSKALLSGENSLLNSTTVGMMLLSATGLATGDATTVAIFNALLNGTFSAAEYVMLLGYIQYMMQVYVAGWVLAPIIAAGGGLIATKSVEQWLWEYDDPLLLFLKANDKVDDAGWALFPPAANDSDPAIAPASTYKTGADDITNIMQYVLWQNMSEIPDRDEDPEKGVWDHVEKIEGTGATQFHPNVTSSETLRVWISDLMRSLDLEYSKDTNVQGIDLLRFVLPEKVLDVDAAYDQTIKGLANMTYAKGVPMFISKPHFLGAAASVGSVSGLTPVSADHDTYIDVEPNTGVVMNAAKRLQVNFQVEAGNYLTTGIAATHYMPLIWIEEGGSVTKDVADAFKETIYGARQLQQASPLTGGAIGAIFIYASLFVAVRSRKP